MTWLVKGTEIELEARIAVLRKKLDEAPGANRLAEARTALNVPGLKLGSREWLAARTAVGKFRAVQDFRRERVQQLQQLASGAANASMADKAKMRQVIEYWSDSVRSQEANYTELLQRLAWTGE
ncbi:MAG: hypothetical protein ABIQ32_04720 [Sphingomicrobium sp.]